MNKKKILKLFRGCSLVGFVSIFLFVLPRIISTLMAAPRTYSLEEIPEKKVAIIFGAGITRDGRPTAVLRDRVEAGVSLYEAGKVEFLLMSGDNRFEDYNEPLAMKTYAMELGVPEEAIVMDFAGRRTYDTCYRAKYIFGVGDAILVTQQFHLPRSIFLAKSFGIDAVGYSSDLRTYRKSTMIFWNIRELPAAFTAYWDVYVRKPLPILGEYEPIFKE
jgi:SanA protein